MVMTIIAEVTSAVIAEVTSAEAAETIAVRTDKYI